MIENTLHNLYEQCVHGTGALVVTATAPRPRGAGTGAIYKRIYEYVQYRMRVQHAAGGQPTTAHSHQALHCTLSIPGEETKTICFSFVHDFFFFQKRIILKKATYMKVITKHDILKYI